MSGGNTETQKQTSSQSVVRAPYGAGEPALKTGLSDALSMYRSNQLSPYTPMAQETKEGLYRTNAEALRGAEPLRQALGTFEGMTDPSGQLGRIASGEFIGQEDPNYRAIIDRAKQEAGTSVNMMSGARGRFGSDFHQGTLAREIGNIEADYGYRRLQDEQARQMAAIDRQMGAAAATPGAYQATLAPFQTQVDVGRAYEADAEARAGNKANNLSALMAILRAAEPYGSASTTGTGTGSTQKPTNWAGIAGGTGLTLASLLG